MTAVDDTSPVVLSPAPWVVFATLAMVGYAVIGWMECNPMFYVVDAGDAVRPVALMRMRIMMMTRMRMKRSLGTGLGAFFQGEDGDGAKVEPVGGCSVRLLSAGVSALSLSTHTRSVSVEDARVLLFPSLALCSSRYGITEVAPARLHVCPLSLTPLACPQ